MTENKDVSEEDDDIANYNLDTYYEDNGGIGEADRRQWCIF